MCALVLTAKQCCAQAGESSFQIMQKFASFMDLTLG
jgi:hypothetical protein